MPNYKVFDDLIARVQKLETSMNLYVSRIVKENEAYIIDMNVEDQLYAQGINKLGIKISEYQPYTPLTIAIKKIKGQPTDHVTLRDTGEFHSSFYLTIYDTYFLISARDEKTKKLVKKYGWQIFGLTKDSMSDLINSYIYPEIIQKTRELLIYGRE